jgi:hypothetical protein
VHNIHYPYRFTLAQRKILGSMWNMKKVVVLIIGALIYIYFLQIGQDAAQAGLVQTQYLYTSAQAQAAAISSSDR